MKKVLVESLLGLCIWRLHHVDAVSTVWKAEKSWACYAAKKNFKFCFTFLEISFLSAWYPVLRRYCHCAEYILTDLNRWVYICHCFSWFYFVFLIFLMCKMIREWRFFIYLFIYNFPFPPPHLGSDPPRCCPDWPVGRLRSWVRLLRLSLPPRRRTQRSGRSEVAGEAVFCGRRGWRTGKPQSFLWPSRDPNHDGIPASSELPSRAGRLASRELRCPAQPSWWRTARRVHCEGLKQKFWSVFVIINSVNQYNLLTIVVWQTVGKPGTKIKYSPDYSRNRNRWRKSDEQRIKSVVGCWWPGKSASCPLAKCLTCGRKNFGKSLKAPRERLGNISCTFKTMLTLNRLYILTFRGL